MEQTPSLQLNISDFSRLEFFGAEEVLAFDENQIELSLNNSTLLIVGSALVIESFSKAPREITVTGNIEAVFKETKKLKRPTFLSRLFP